MQIQLFGTTSSEIDGSPDTTAAAAPGEAVQAAAPSTPQDLATLSSSSTSISSLTQQALEVASTMEGRVLALREAVSSGQYSVEPNQIADAMLSEGV
jgi:flagellar biosynthesis anti-sigma factor FlgM